MHRILCAHLLAMFEILNSYLFQNKSIGIPGLGTLYLEGLPASVDTTNQNMLPPLHYFRFDKYSDTPDRQFFSYLATEQNTAEYEALRTYNEFCHDLRERINLLGRVHWEGLGDFVKDADGNTVFESTLGNPPFMQPVPARKVIHPDAKHVLLVGDMERTNFEMNEWLQQEQEGSGRKRWWLYALIAAAVAILVLIFHFSFNGWKVESSGNQQKIEVDK